MAHCPALAAWPCILGGAMDWSASTGWWLAAGVLVAAELATGTFYLLMLALGAAAWLGRRNRRRLGG